MPPADGGSHRTPTPKRDSCQCYPIAGWRCSPCPAALPRARALQGSKNGAVLLRPHRRVGIAAAASRSVCSRCEALTVPLTVLLTDDWRLIGNVQQAAPSSSGQDSSLSRCGQEFDSPWGHQQNRRFMRRFFFDGGPVGGPLPGDPGDRITGTTTEPLVRGRRVC